MYSMSWPDVFNLFYSHFTVIRTEGLYSNVCCNARITLPTYMQTEETLEIKTWEK